MSSMVSDKRLKSEIQKELRRLIQSGEILDISLERGQDSDRDDVIFVHVIFDNKTNRLDARETSVVTRHVRDRLSKIGESSFPLFYYIAKSEAGKLAAAS